VPALKPAQGLDINSGRWTPASGPASQLYLPTIESSRCMRMGTRIDPAIDAHGCNPGDGFAVAIAH